MFIIATLTAVVETMPTSVSVMTRTTVPSQGRHVTSGNLPDMNVRAFLLDKRGPKILMVKLLNNESRKETVNVMEGMEVRLHTSSKMTESGTSTDIIYSTPNKISRGARPFPPIIMKTESRLYIYIILACYVFDIYPQLRAPAQ